MPRTVRRASATRIFLGITSLDTVGNITSLDTVDNMRKKYDLLVPRSVERLVVKDAAPLNIYSIYLTSLDTFHLSESRSSGWLCRQ